MLEGAPYFLLEGLDTGRIDLAVMVEPRNRLATEPLVSETLYLIGAGGKPGMPASPCAVRDLENLPPVLFSRPSGSRMSVEAARHGVRLNVRFEVTSPDVAKDFVRRGLGFGLMPQSSIYRDARAGELSAVRCDGLRLTRAFVRRADRPASPAVEAVASLIPTNSGR